MLFILLAKAPEPSPLVMLLAAVVVWCPAVHLWSSVLGYMPKLASPNIDPTGQATTFIIVVCAVFIVMYWSNGALLYAVERFFPSWVDDYRI